MKKWKHHPLSHLEPSVVVNQEAEEVWFCRSTGRTCHLWHVVSHSAVSSTEANHLRTRVSGYILFIPGIIKRLFLAVYSLISLSTLPLKHTVSTMVAVGNHHARSGTNCSTKLSVSVPRTEVLAARLWKSHREMGKEWLFQNGSIVSCLVW